MPTHIGDVLAEDLSFCRGVMGGGYTANNQTYAFKPYTRHTQKSEKREREREREREKQKPGKSGNIWARRYFKNKHLEYTTLSKITTSYMFSRNPMDSLLKCKGSNF